MITRAARRHAQLPAEWQAGCARLGVAWLGCFVLFRADWAAMLHQWWDSSTYNHILFVPAIVGWLAAQRLPGLLSLPVRVWRPGLGLMAGVMALWVLGALAGFAQVTQLAVVAMLIACVPLLLGPAVALGLAFPLAYMLFLVPFGDELIPLLQTLTAKITIALVHLSGIRAQIDGVFIATPAGLFEVAEACSGVKFLVAMVAFGVLAAHVCFISWRRRAGFMAACVAVPVLANGVRAWGTVYAAQIWGRAVAGGIDHIVYGWFFFAAVIAAILAGAWHWFDRPAGAPMIDVEAIAAQSPGGAGLSPALALGALGAMTLGAHLWVIAAEKLAAPMPAAIALPQVPGWQRVAYAPHAWWQPRAGGADHRLLGSYQDAAGRRVDVFYALYAAQGPGRKAGGWGEGALLPGGIWAWKAPGPAVADAHTEWLLAGGPTQRLAETTYRTGDLATGSNLRLKLANIEDRLLLRRRATMLLILSAEQRPGQNAEAAITAFRAATGPAGPWMDGIGKGL